MNYLYLLGVVLAVAAFFWPVRLWVDYRHRGKTEDTLLIQFCLWGGIGSLTFQVPVITTFSRGIAIRAEVGSKKKHLDFPLPTVKQLRQYWQIFKKARRILHRVFSLFRRTMRIKRFVWHTEMGMNDSARLAQLTGALWAVKGTTCAALLNWFSFVGEPVFRVCPRFNRSYFRMVITCILEFPLGYAIIVTCFAIGLALKLKLIKRGEGNGRTSNPRPDEDSHGKYQRNGGCKYSDR